MTIKQGDLVFVEDMTFTGRIAAVAGEACIVEVLAGEDAGRHVPVNTCQCQAVAAGGDDLGLCPRARELLALALKLARARAEVYELDDDPDDTDASADLSDMTDGLGRSLSAVWQRFCATVEASVVPADDDERSGAEAA